MKKIFFVSIVFIFIFISGYADADTNLEPKTNNGKKWRIGYIEGGSYENYTITLKTTIEGLMELGFIQKAQIPLAEGDKDALKLWKWLVANLKSDFIQLLPDAFWTSNWKEEERKKNRESCIKQLKEKKMDLILAVGTWSGQDLANNEHSVPTVVICVSNAIQSKIIKSEEDSGYDHVHARVDPTRYIRQVRLFHHIVGFKKLGISYENSEYGRTYGAVKDVEIVAKEKGFELIHCNFGTADQLGSFANQVNAAVSCINTLSQKVDAIFLTLGNYHPDEAIPRLLEATLKYKIPTFAQKSSGYVKYGALFSMSQAGYTYDGMFHATCIAKIFNGVKPRNIPQLYEAPERIAINMKTAKIIGFEVQTETLKIADEFYNEIFVPTKKVNQ
ncbi:MAG: ABC transporter substrate-binding protein [Desulfobacterales bacterium]|nr:ABC transporter substrate-binding protein [Desulfobacterales bacterium]MBF0398481.1 ABC transporter substrate-binding protein [Desulfobacterales bacterium]